MAEAFGIAGSAFGAISLGLQLFQQISQYLDDVEGRDEDLRQARSYAKLVQTSLIALHGAVIHATTNNFTARDAINQCETSCTVAIDSLLKAVEEVKGSDAVSNNRTTKAKELYVKLKYPFKKLNIENLEKRLLYTNNFLQTALTVLQLNNHNATHNSILSVQQTVNILQLATEDSRLSQERTHKTSVQLYEALQFVHQDVREVLTQLKEPSDSNRKGQILVRNRESLRTVSGSILTSQKSNPNTAVSSIKTAKYQSGNSFTIGSFCYCRTRGKRRDRSRWGPFIIETEISFTDDHASGCPISKVLPVKCQTQRILNFGIPAIRSRWRNASQFSLSFTTGTGGLGLGQSLAWVATVDADSSPSFKIIDRVKDFSSFTGEDRKTLLSSCFRRLMWCFTNKQASISDVDKYGQSILDSLSWFSYISRTGGLRFGDCQLQMFWMLADFINFATYTSTNAYALFFTRFCQSTLGRHSNVAGDMITSLLFGGIDSVGHECKSSWFLWNPQQRFDFIGDIPRIAEYLEFGQLSRAIIKEDKCLVNNLLERFPSSINEINYLRQSPMHIATEIQNVAILETLLKHADAKILNTIDNNGYYPIDYATDALRHPDRPEIGNSPENCKGCTILGLLLQSETALFGCSVRRALELPSCHVVPCCKEGQKIVIKNLVCRREELAQLARRELSPSERRDLKICQDGVLDQNAAQVQQYLEDRACYIPTHLRVFDDARVPKDSQYIYTAIRQGEIAEFALQSGFSYPATMFQDLPGLLPLWPILQAPQSFIHGFQDYLFSSYICWMVEHGANLRCHFPTGPALAFEGNTTGAHWFMTYLGLSILSLQRGLRPSLSPEVLNVILSEDIVDDCRCWCSPRGCTPFTKLLGGIEKACTLPFFHSELESKLENLERSEIKALEDLVNIISEGGCELVNRPWVDSTILRYYTFLMLDLRHTCCCLEPTAQVSCPLPEDECKEIREEDSTRLELLERLINEFETERGHYTEFFSFMRECWVPKMRMVDKELASSMLTDQQRREAEVIGVIWDTYGPRPPPCSKNQVETDQVGEVISELEKALRELDEIATDPERPFVG